MSCDVVSRPTLFSHFKLFKDNNLRPATSFSWRKWKDFSANYRSRVRREKGSREEKCTKIVIDWGLIRQLWAASRVNFAFVVLCLNSAKRLRRDFNDARIFFCEKFDSRWARISATTECTVNERCTCVYSCLYIYSYLLLSVGSLKAILSLYTSSLQEGKIWKLK